MEQPKIIYVQAHGGGSETLDNKFISLNQYRKSIGNRAVDAITPYIIRIVSPGKSANSNFDSDRENVNFLYNMLTNPETRSQFLNTPHTRSFSGAYSDKMEGSRGHGELLTSTSLFSSNDIIYNEIVEVELEKKSGKIHSGEGGEEDPGGFGIFVRNGEDWKERQDLSSQILVDSGGNTQDITILKIVNFIIEKEGPNIIVIFPNCSPFSDVSYTNATKRSMWSRIKTANGEYQKQIDINSQFKLALEIITRVKNFFEGQKRWSEFISREETPSASNSGDQKKLTSEDRIGIFEKDDFVSIFQLFLYFFKDYYSWSQISDELRFSDINYILGQENIPKNLNVVKFIMALLLLIFRSHERHGGIIYDSNEEKKGRQYVWENIVIQSEYGPRGRKGNYREDKMLSEATQEQDELFDFVEEINSKMVQSDPNIPRYTNFDTLIRFALEFATTASKGGLRKNFLRKSSQKTRKSSRKKLFRKKLFRKKLFRKKFTKKKRKSKHRGKKLFRKKLFTKKLFRKKLFRKKFSKKKRKSKHRQKSEHRKKTRKI